MNKAINHLLTASRKGDRSIRTMILLNSLFMGLLVGICFFLWYLTKTWIFPEFDPLSYWNMDGNFWINIIPISIPVIAYAIFLGQLDWFNDDSKEDGTLVSENIMFKGLISFFAGLFEELGHRGIFIWVGLIIVYLSNIFFSWFIALLLALIFIAIAAKISSTLINLGILVVFIGGWIYLREILENPVHLINGFILAIYQWIVEESLRIYIIYFLLMLLALLAMGSKLKEMHPADIILRLIAFVVWTAYALPKGVEVLGNLPITPLEADKWVVLLYVGAVMWSNVKFKEGHKYQGEAGMLHSYIFAFYMTYLAFTFGLLYAIAVHFLYDLFIFLSEHLVQVIKNRKHTYY